MRLTKMAVEGARRRDGEWRWDDQVRGFGLRIHRSGTKSFVVSYRFKGRKRILSLGLVGRLTVFEARKRAMKVLGDVADGKDPLAGRGIGENPLVVDLFERYMREHAESKKKPSSVREDRRMWESYVLPALGRRRVDQISTSDMHSLHAGMHTTPYQANRLMELLRKAFRLAELWGWREKHSNPCDGIDRYRERRRERFLSENELTRLSDALVEAERTGTESPFLVAAIKLLMYTGCRPSEIRTLRWEYVDLSRRCLFLPDSKTGRRTVYLNSAAIEVLEGLPHAVGNPYVIVGEKQGKCWVNLRKPWLRIRESAGLENVRLYDLRHTYASYGAIAGLTSVLLQELMGHKSIATTMRYVHLTAGPMLEAAEVIGERLPRT